MPTRKCHNLQLHPLVVAISLLLSPASEHIAAQSTHPPVLPAPPSHFEVASIRPHGGPLHTIAGFNFFGQRLTLEGYTLKLLIQEAYDLRDYQVAVNPASQKSIDMFNTYYDLAAVTDKPEPTREDIRAMLRTLLQERFNLTTHTEPRDLPVYNLVVARSGPRLTVSSPDAVQQGAVFVHGRNQVLSEVKESMNKLATDLSGAFAPDRPVIDQTGLTGLYDIKLEATPQFRIAADPQPEDLSIFNAIQDQLGLKLVPAKAPVSILVVDHATPPTPN